MALGGGTFLTQNKILPGAYINFISASRAGAATSDRGYGALPLELSWGPEGEVFAVDTADFQKESKQIFGYDYTHEALKPLRDFFKNASTGYFYRLGSGVKAACEWATAKYAGVRGNDLKIVSQKDVDDESKFQVNTLLDGKVVDSQTVGSMGELLDNPYVDFVRDAELEVSAGKPLEGGADDEGVTGADYQDFLDKIEPYAFNTLGCPTASAEISALFVAFTKRMRDEMGAKFQLVAYHTAADYEGVINLKNDVAGDANEAALVFWMTGAAAGCAVNASNTNKTYDGEYTVNVSHKRRDLEEALQKGELVFHKAGDDVRVLEDINSLVTLSQEKNADFQSNQTIRVLDQVGNDIAVLFNNRYLGKVPNDASGRVSFWNDLVTYNQELEQIQAITGFEAEDIVVEQGSSKNSVVVSNAICPVNCMSKLYMTVVVE